MFMRRGQSILEYTIIIGIVTVVLYYLGTPIKRGVQSLIKVTADQVGIQRNSDQDFISSQQGFMEGSNSYTNQSKLDTNADTGYINASGTVIYVSNMSVNESTDTQTNTVTNGGFSAGT